MEYNFFCSLHRHPAFFFHFLSQLTRFPSSISNEKPDAIVSCLAAVDQVFGSFKVSSPVDVFCNLFSTRNLKRQSVQKMELYSESIECRSAFWIKHFTNKHTLPCGKCDNCKKFSIKPSDIEIEVDILERLKSPVLFETFVMNIPIEFKNEYLKVLNYLLDHEKVQKTANNELFLSA